MALGSTTVCTPCPLTPLASAHRGLPLGLLVVQVRELEASRLVGGAEVLVDERGPELLDVHRAR
jgi:hypothetical protein